MIEIKAAPFGKTANGEPVTAFTRENSAGMSVRVLDYGGTVQSIVVPDRDGNPVDTALGYDDIGGYEKGSCWFGAFVGRYANRIGNASFSLGGRRYYLPKNDGSNHLHGAFSHRVMDAEIRDDALLLRLTSPDGEEGFPGTLRVTVTCRLLEDNTLRLEYHAVTDRDTVLNLTNHTYFNLSGGGDVLDHFLRLHASRFTETSADLIPTGRILPVEGTALDFRAGKPVGRDLFSGDPLLTTCGGYDHNFILDNPAGVCGEAWSDKTGIVLTFSTTEPGVQLYTGNFTDTDAAAFGKNGVRYPRYAGFCLEAQHYPDSPNRPEFPSTVLRPGEEFRSFTEYRFSIK